jgi:glycine C-acetyltransferase/8-amino-7-oxononanoate synthase
MNLDAWLEEQLAAIETANLRRRLRRLDSAQGAEVVVAGQSLVNFSSNDYLGLADDARLRAAAAAAIDRYGVGSGASRLVCGTQGPHVELEAALARFKRTEAALTFSTGYAAAVGTIPALAGADDVLILDKLCHASLVDAARLSGATIRIFPHNHLGKLERLLAWGRETKPHGNVIVVTESVFSMDGDLAPLGEIVELKDRFGAWLFVDEAHGVGVLGPNGRGLAAELGLGDRVEIQMGTLGKALGASGGVICGSARLIDLIINRARSFIFSTAAPAAAAAAAAEAVRLLDTGEAEPLRRQLWANIQQLGAAASSRALPTSAIVPVIIGGESEAMAASEGLKGQGLLVPAIRYPTVAKGQARLRVTLSAAHSPDQISRLAGALTELA